MGGLIQFFAQNPFAIPLFLVMFPLIVAVHEFGHYITGRLLGTRVLELSFGLPRRPARRAARDRSTPAAPRGRGPARGEADGGDDSADRVAAPAGVHPVRAADRGRRGPDRGAPRAALRAAGGSAGPAARGGSH